MSTSYTNLSQQCIAMLPQIFFCCTMHRAPFFCSKINPQDQNYCLGRQYCRLSICFVLIEFDKSEPETNPNNNLMMRLEQRDAQQTTECSIFISRLTTAAHMGTQKAPTSDDKIEEYLYIVSIYMSVPFHLLCLYLFLYPPLSGMQNTNHCII